MSSIRGLELLFNMEKENLQSKEDCLVAALHCLLIFHENLKSKEDSLITTLHRLSLFDDNLNCVGTGDEWPDEDPESTELLPENWNSNQDVYSLRYSNENRKTRILLKASKMEHIFQVDAVMNEDVVASMSIPVNNYISDDYSEFSNAYKNLESLIDTFRKDIIEKLNMPNESPSRTPYLVFKNSSVPSPSRENPQSPKDPSQPTWYPNVGGSDLDPSGGSSERDTFNPPKNPSQPPRYPRVGGPHHDPDPRNFFPPPRNPSQPPRYPRVGGSDLDPLAGPDAGGMFVDPSSLGIPPRPTLPEFGVGGPGGLPRGAVPPGARFDPIIPPIIPPDRKRNPDPHPDLFPPPDFEDDM